MTSDPGKVDLDGVDIIVSYRESDAERRDNLYAVLAHLDLTYCDYTLWLIEGDVRPRFDWGRVNDPKIRHMFIYDDGPFPKALLYNTAVRAGRADVLCFHDADSIADPQTMDLCARRIREAGEAAAISPFYRVVNVQGVLRDHFLSHPAYESLAALPDSDPAGTNILYDRAPGGIVFFRRDIYCSVGGYNPEFRGWGGEDNEMFLRLKALGLACNSFDRRLIHLNHGLSDRENHSADPAAVRNWLLAETVTAMPRAELEALVQRLARFFD